MNKIHSAVVVGAVALLCLSTPVVHADPKGGTVDGPIDATTLLAAEVPYAFSIPAANVYRFEVHHNDFGWHGDEANNNRRCELIAHDHPYFSGETLWSSFSFVVGPKHDALDPGGSVHNEIHQWHSIDSHGEARAPVVDVQLTDGGLLIQTRSDDLGSSSPEVQYSRSRPTDGAVHNMVISGRLGEAGRLNVWLDGSQIVDKDVAIGYYKDDGGRRALAYPHWGLYEENVHPKTIVFLANIEWGTETLSARIESPLTVTTPPGGWV